MTTTLEANDLISQKLEVNSNIKIGGDELAGDRAGSDGKTVGVKCDAVPDGLDDKVLDLNDKKNEDRNHKSGVIANQENHCGSLSVNVNGETTKSLDPKMNVVNGEGTPVESRDVSQSPAGGSDSPAATEPPNKNSQESPSSQEQLDGETDSIGSGKSPKKKKGLLSGGLHLHLPKFSSRLSFGSDVSGTSTGSDLEGSPDKKKRKKGKKNKKEVNLTTNDQGDQENVTPSEYSESVASERVDPLDGVASVNDLGLDNQTEQQDQEQLPPTTPDDQPSNLATDEGENGHDTMPVAAKVSCSEPVFSKEADPEILEKGTSEKIDENESSPAEVSRAEEADTQAGVSSNQSTLPTQDSEPTQKLISNSDDPTTKQTTPPEAVEESKPEESAIKQVDQSTSSPGEPSPQEGDEEITEDKKGSTSSGEEGEEEDEGELDEGKQRKKKKRKGILNVHFPHFGGKKGKSGEKSSDQSSDSDRALSPKRFGWKKRKDARSPERKEDKEEELDATNTEAYEGMAMKVETSKEEAEKQEGEQQSEAQEPDIKTMDVALSPPDPTDDVPKESTENNVRPEEKLLAECKEYLVEDDVEAKPLEESMGEDFTTTDALLEQIAETITSIEKAQNLRTSQALDVNVVADTAPAAGQDEGLDLQAEIPSNVDEQAINIPSAQITLAVPTESTLLEVSEEDKVDKVDGHATEVLKEAKEEGMTEPDGETGSSDVKEAQEGEASSSPGKSPRFKLHLPKFHLPKVHLSGKKDKKKTDTTQEEEANTTREEEDENKDIPSQDAEVVVTEVQERLEGDGTESTKGSDVDIKSDISAKADIGVTVNMDAKTDVGVTVNMDSPDGMVPETEGVDEKMPSVVGSVIPDEANSLLVEARNISLNVNEKIEPKVERVVEAEVPSAQPVKEAEVSAALTSADMAKTAGICNPSASLELTGADLDTKCSGQESEQGEVVVVMNEVTSEEEEVLDSEKIVHPSEEPADGKAKSTKKGRFKMPSINFHMPKFGGNKKSYKVDTNEEFKNCIVEEGRVNGIEPGVQLEAVDVIPNVESDLQTKLDVEVTAGGGDLSIEPEVLDSDYSECKQQVPGVNKIDVLLDDKEIVVAASADAEFEKPSINIDSDVCHASVDPSLSVVSEEITLKTEASSMEVLENVDVACEGVEASPKDNSIPEIETNVEGPSVSVTVEEPPSPALDQEASIKAKKKGLSLPTMHFRPKFTGKKWSRHPRFRSKVKENKPLSASSKVATSLPNVATTTSLENPMSADERKTRRASDVIDPKIAADIVADHEISAAGDVDETPQKSKRSRFRFPSLHFSLPRFSSLMSPNKSQNSEEVEEPEMTEIKPEVETLDITAEADIPKTNLNVVMPEISGMTESTPEVDVEGAAGRIEDLELGKHVPDVDTVTNPQSVTIGECLPEIEMKVDPVTEANPPDIKATDPLFMDETAKERAVKAEIDSKVPAATIPSLEGTVIADANVPELDLDANLDLCVVDDAVMSPDVVTDAANTSSEVKKGKKKSFLPNVHLPKLNVKGTPLKFRLKAKKGTDIDGGGKTEGEVDNNVRLETPTSPDLRLVVNTSGEPSAELDAAATVQKVHVEAKETPKTLLEISAAAADANVVKKSEIDVKSPSLASTDTNVPTADVGVEVEVQGKESVPEVSAELPDSIPLSGTVVIAYDTIVEPEIGSIENIDGEGKVDIADDDAPGIVVDSGATNQVLDLALGGGKGGVEQEKEVDLHISSSDNEGTDTKKKKRKGLHMPSINLPKFHLRHDKKPASIVDANLPDVVVPNGQVDGGDIKLSDTQEVVVPEADLALKVERNIVSEAEAEQKLDPPSAVEAAAVVACVAMEVGPPETEQSSEKENQKESLPTVEGSLMKAEDPPNIEIKISPKVEQVVEAVVPSVCQAVTETLPDMAVSADVEGEDATIVIEDSAPAQLEVDNSGLDADAALDDSSTSKPIKTKKARMPKINFPKMNFKLSPHKTEASNPVVSMEEVHGTDDPSLTPAEIDQIEGSIQSGQAQVSDAMVEVNGGSAEVVDDESTPTVKKGKYRKRIGGKLKRIRGKSKGKSPMTEDIKGEGLAPGVSLEADGELAVDAGVDILENGLCSTVDADATLESDSPLVHANDLITSTPIKPAVDTRLCKNNSAQQANSEPTTPESMNIDAAITINSLPAATPEAVSPIAESRPFWVVVAIDFGTTFSGYAYSLTQEPDNVHIMRKWEGGDPGVTNMKTPTTLLLTPEGEFHSFGFTARDFYHDMDHKEAVKWLYFDKFKLTLHGDPNLNMKTEIKAANGQSFPAATVFEHSLRFFHDHAVDELCDQSIDGEVDPRDIRWVLTVPAIWKQPAKQFMRQAAYKAGLASPSRPDQLLIALEPEAASIYIRKLRLRELAPEHQSQRQKWLRSSTGKITKSNSKVSESIRHGTRYMVVDCGGGTVDITVHEVEEGLGTLKELHKAAGGRYGSVSIDQEFEQLLVDIFSCEFLEEFKVKRPAGWVDLMIAFEARKRNASPWKNNPLNVSLPFSFIDYYKKYTNGKQMEEAVRRYNSKDVSWSAQGMLRFTPEGMQRLFASTVERLITGVEQVLSSPSLTGISYLFVVGGFAQSALLQSAIRKKFSSQMRIIIPRDLGLSILKGAVLFGLDPSAVRVRRSRLTYGVGVLNKFQPGVHPEEKKVSKDNADWCKDIFDTFVQADESVAVGDKVTRSYTPAKPSQQAIIINIYCSDRENVRFITDEGVRKCGTLHIDVTDSQYSGMRGRRELQLTMQYGDTEIKVSALDVPTGKCVKSNIDFLNK